MEQYHDHHHNQPTYKHTHRTDKTTKEGNKIRRQRENTETASADHQQQHLPYCNSCLLQYTSMTAPYAHDWLVISSSICCMCECICYVNLVQFVYSHLFTWSCLSVCKQTTIIAIPCIVQHSTTLDKARKAYKLACDVAPLLYCCDQSVFCCQCSSVLSSVCLCVCCSLFCGDLCVCVCVVTKSSYTFGFDAKFAAAASNDQ